MGLLKSIRYLAIFLVIVTLGFWTALQFDAVQTWAKSKASHYILQETGCSVTVGNFRGAPPFLLAADNIAFSDPEIGKVSIESVDLIPSWFEILFGRISFLWITAHGIDIRELKTTPNEKTVESFKDLLPPVSFAIHSLHLSDIHVPKKYYEPLLNTYSDQTLIDCVYTISGRLSWNPNKEKLSVKLNATPYVADLTPITANLNISAYGEKTRIASVVDALKMPDGSVFFTLAVDRLTFEANLEAQTADVLKVLFGSLSTTDIPEFSGNWNINGLHRQKSHAGLNPVLRFMAQGSFQAEGNSDFSFATTDISCQKIQPILTYTQSKKQRAQVQIAMANAEDAQDASTLSHIINIPTPRSIEGSIKRDNANVMCTLIASSLTIADHNIPTCSISLVSAPHQSGWKGSFNADLALVTDKREIPITLATNFISENALQWQLPDTALTIGGHTVAGNLQLDLFPLQIQGTLESQKTDAKELAACFNATLGSLDCKFDFDADKINAAVSLNTLAYSSLTCKKADISLTSSGFFKDITSGFKAQNIESDSLFLKLIDLQSKLDPEKTCYLYSLLVDGKSKAGPCSLDCKGTFKTGFFTLDSFKANSGGHTITSTLPVLVTKEKDSLSVSAFEFTSDTNMHMQGNVFVNKQTLGANLTCANLPLECFDPFFGDLTLFGNVSGHLELGGTRRDPQLVATLASSDFCFWNPQKIKAPALSASCEITVEHSLLHLASEIEGLSLKKPTVFELTAPLKITPTSICFSDATNLSGHLQSEFDTNTLLSSYLDEDELMEGIVHIDAKVAGTVSKPIIMGAVSWNDGRLLVPSLGTLFSSIQMSGHIHDNCLLIEKLSATDASDGTFQAKGWIKELNNPKIHYSLEAHAKEFNTIALDEAEAKATGKLITTGDLEHIRFEGNFEVTDAKLKLSPTISKDIPKIDITYIAQDNDHLTQKNPFRVDLDLYLTMDKGIVHGMGLESEWKGSAHLSGAAKALDTKGQILLQKGTLEFAGKQFALTKGSLDFQGDLFKKSMLQVIATNEVGSINTQIVLQGPLDSPRIVIQSNPAMSQKEILSWLLFNKSSSEITPMQGIQLGQTLLKMKGTTGNFDVIEEIKQKLGIDRIDFGPSSSARPQVNGASSNPSSSSPAPGDSSIPNEVSVQVGKYISDGVIVTLSKDVTNEVNRVGIEANISKHITAQANVGDDAETELSLEWKVRY